MDIDKKLRELLAEFDEPPGSPSPEMFRHLEKTKPTDDELQGVPTIIKAEKARIEIIEAKVAILQQIVQDLSLKREERKRRVTLYRALIAPISSIPVEILSAIFVHFMEEPTISMIKWRSVVCWISQVNSFWRAVALSTPCLWTTIVCCRHFKASSDVPLTKAWWTGRMASPLHWCCKVSSTTARVDLSRSSGL